MTPPSDNLQEQDPIPVQSNEQGQWQGESQYDGPEPSTADSDELHVRSSRSSEDLENGRFPLPIWLRESSKSFRWKWVPLPLRTAARTVSRWSYGPDPPQIQRITPFVPVVQEAPLWLVERFLPRKIHKAIALVLFHLAWLLAFSLIIRESAASGHIEGYGTPQSIWCGAHFWYDHARITICMMGLLMQIIRSNGNGCGINGNNCRPFENTTFPFRCSANCGSMKISNPYVVGDQEINYKQLVIGGPVDDTSNPIYRADSFICQSAVHADIVSNTQGGCGVAKHIGSQSSFPSVSSNGINSTSFDSVFPKSYTFLSHLSSDCGVVDMRWPLLGVTLTFTIVFSLFVSSPVVFFTSTFTLLFFHVGLVSDPPNLSDYPSLTSLAIGRFLPAAFVATIFYKYCVRRQLYGLTAQFEKTILWLGPAWVGALSNYTFDWIPIQRLTPRDIGAEAGGLLTLLLIIALILLIAAGQIYYFRLEGRFRRYITLYAGMGIFLLICVALPMLNLRIHHYILAMLFLPGTSMQTRPSMIYQGLLIGLFINGIARWGFDSLLQTSAALFGGGPQETALPNVTAVVGAGIGSIGFKWGWPPVPYDGVSVLVNDVERGRWYIGEGNGTFTWERRDIEIGKNEYFRFAFMRGSGAGDYTEAGVWDGREWRGGKDEDKDDGE